MGASNKKVDLSNPMLMNGYGKMFEYKDSALSNMVSEKIHQKRLNLEREISKHKMQKKLEKHNYYKFKNSAKTTYNSTKTSIKLKFKSNKKSINEILKSNNKLIPFEEFIISRYKMLKKELNEFRKLTIKSLNSMQYSDDEDDILALKTKEYKNKAIIKEDMILSEMNFLWKILELHPKFTEKELLRIESLKVVVASIIDDNKDKEYLFKSINSLFKAYKKQYFFTYKNETEQLKSKLEKLQVSYKEEMTNAKQNYKKSLLDEQKRIRNKYTKNCDEAKRIFAKSKEAIELKNLNQQEQKANQELKELSRQNKHKILEIKKLEKSKYKEKISEYKKTNKSEFKFWSDKKEAIANSENTSNLRLMLDPKLYSLNNWKYKNDISEIKANYLQSVGMKIKDLTFDGEFLYKNGVALQECNQKKFKNNSKIVSEVNDQSELVSQFKKMSDKDKEIFDQEVSKLKEKLNKDLSDLKLKLSNKEITRQAYKLSKMKLEIFYEEDIKSLKMNLESSKSKYISKDILIRYHRQNQLINKELEQERNKISKEVPIEYKKNNSIWMTALAFIFPGIDSLILKKWKKAILFLIVSCLVWALFIPYAFGEFNIQGRGIIGLIKLSWPTGVDSPVYGPVYSDARYALTEGVVGLMLLIFSISYLVASAYQCFKITRAMEKGIRANTWVETKKILRTSGFPYAISIPGLILISFIVVMPIVVSLLLAFTNIGTDHNPAGGQESNWVGFEQFIELFTNKEFFKPFGNVLWWNIVWAISTTALVLFLGTVMALAVENRNIKAKAFWRIIFILPWAIPAFLSILFFKVIFGDGDTSFINSILIDAGMTPIKWQTDVIMSRVILILIQGWLGHSYIVLLVSGNMKSISSDIYEAASIDGAKPFKQFMKMTLPIVLLQIAPLLIGQFTFNFNNFSIIWMFNDGGSKIDPSYVYDVGNCDIILSWIFKMTFSSQAINITSNQAIASALVIVMSVFIVSASGIGFARSKAFRKGEDI